VGIIEPDGVLLRGLVSTLRKSDYIEVACYTAEWELAVGWGAESCQVVVAGPGVQISDVERRLAQPGQSAGPPLCILAPAGMTLGWILQASRLGVSAVVDYDAAVDELTLAVATALAGGWYVGSAAARDFAKLTSIVWRRVARYRWSTLASLSVGERELLALLGQSKTNHEIADSLYLSNSTAKGRVGQLLAKLGIGNRSEAAQIALAYEVAREVGLIPRPAEPVPGRCAVGD
jgi:DNA-binding NarL/FixJ family response regulator